ncbi:hypothetical protein CHCC20368_2593 [Bacillus licheniformis]|nr:hypothetical protein CHCC20368_2593 [Bacillus licheniformis]
MRVKPIIAGKDAERFLKKVRRNNRKIEDRGSQRKKGYSDYLVEKGL